jgi:hypothetical protein
MALSATEVGVSEAGDLYRLAPCLPRVVVSGIGTVRVGHLENVDRRHPL